LLEISLEDERLRHARQDRSMAMLVIGTIEKKERVWAHVA